MGYYYATVDYRNDIVSKKVIEYIDTDQLLSVFSEDEQAGNERFLGKVIVVSGRVASVTVQEDKPTIILETNSPMSGIVCELNVDLYSSDQKVEVGDYISIKGECTGYLMDIILVNCIIADHHEE